MKEMIHKPSPFKIWFTAARPHTLTASLSPCLVAHAATRPPVRWQILWTVFCVSVQLGTNLHNDYSDYVQGADTDKRVGQPRATAQGWLTPTQTCTAACGCLGITLLSGVELLRETNQLGNAALWIIILSSVFNAFAYTAGPFPLGYVGLGNCSIAYSGLGDVFVFLYFGLVAVLMLPHLIHVSGYATIHNWPSLYIYASQVGLLGMNIIVVNNLRDRHTDIVAGKRTTAVRFGKKFSLTEYTVCLILTYALVMVDVYQTRQVGMGWLPLLSIPVAVREIQAVFAKDGSDLNMHVGGAAKVQFLFCILLSARLLMVVR